MTKRATGPVILVAGAAAAAAAAATYIGRRRLSVVRTRQPGLIEPESVELPVGRSADPEIDARTGEHRANDETSGGLLRGEYEPAAEGRGQAHTMDAALDEIWNSLPGFAEGEQTEGYDAVMPEDLGAVWLERATQTTHETRPHASDPSEVPELENLLVGEATLHASELDEDEDDDGDYDAEEDRESEEERH